MKRLSFLIFFFLFPQICRSHTAWEHKRTAAPQALADFDQSLPLNDRKILKETAEGDVYHLSPRLRELWNQRKPLKKDAVFWENAERLKQDLLRLPTAKSERVPVKTDSVRLTGRRERSDHGRADEGFGGRAVSSPEREREAEKIAQAAIAGFDEIKDRFQMLRPAVLQNILVNGGLKKEGFCWHWAREFQNRLRTLNLKQFDLLWATAHEAKAREHNTLVIVSRGMDLENGLLLDGWRHSGKPFWTRVATDRYPWKLGAYAGGENE